MKIFEAINVDKLNFVNSITDNKILVGIKCENITDGYHTFTELYNHRYALFYALTRIYDNYITPFNTKVTCWKSKLHSDNTMFEDSFIVGMTVRLFSEEIEYITYHLPLSWWDKFKLLELDKAPPYDGHSSDDVIERLLRL